MSKARRSSDSLKVCALGLWHLGCVTSACLAHLGYTVTAYDPDPKRVRELNDGTPPVYEPGLAELLAEGLASGRLTFTDDLPQAATGAAFVLFTFDTPVDDQDQADIGGILTAAADIAPLLGEEG